MRGAGAACSGEEEGLTPGEEGLTPGEEGPAGETRRGQPVAERVGARQSWSPGWGGKWVRVHGTAGGSEGLNTCERPWT